MPPHNAIRNINLAEDEVADFKTTGIKADVIAESTSGGGVTINGALLTLAADGITVENSLTGPKTQFSSTPVTATADGTGTGLIPEYASFVTITSANAAHQVSLPEGFPGMLLRLFVGANGCELISSVAAAKVNNVTVGATNELALGANTHYICECVAADTWIVRGFTNLGADQAALVPDAL